MKQQHYLKIKEITEKNVILLEKLAEENNTKREQDVSELKKEIELRENKVEKMEIEIDSLRGKCEEKVKLLEKEISKVSVL